MALPSPAVLSLIHDPMPVIPDGIFPPFFDEPAEWTPEVSRKTGVPYFLHKTLQFKEYGERDMRLLVPFRSKVEPHTPHLLGFEILGGRTTCWGSHKFAHPLKFSSGQTEWIRYILYHEEGLLRQLGIYESVFLSLFKYKFHYQVMRAVCECWSPVSNTPFIEDREMTLTLWDMCQTVGLPIHGRPYDEFVPSAECFDRYPPSFSRLTEIYSRLGGSADSGVTLRDWVAFFTSAVGEPHSSWASTSDPLGIGTPSLSYHDLGLRYDHTPLERPPAASDIDSETMVAAFISWWLCYFVIPTLPLGCIRPSVFVAASFMAAGERTSLAVPALANIYRSLRDLCSHSVLVRAHDLVPVHLIAAWVHTHWKETYAPSIPDSLSMVLPLMSGIADADFTPYQPDRARALFAHTADSLRDSASRLRTRMSILRPSRVVQDTRVTFPRSHTSDRSWVDIEFFLSIRYGLLPFRTAGRMMLEVYSPHRVAHQFGYDQACPALIACPPDLEASLMDYSRSWAFILRLGTMVSYYTPSYGLYQGHFPPSYVRWYHAMITPLQSYSPARLASATSAPCVDRVTGVVVHGADQNRGRGRGRDGDRGRDRDGGRGRDGGKDGDRDRDRGGGRGGDGAEDDRPRTPTPERSMSPEHELPATYALPHFMGRDSQFPVISRLHLNYIVTSADVECGRITRRRTRSRSARTRSSHHTRASPVADASGHIDIPGSASKEYHPPTSIGPQVPAQTRVLPSFVERGESSRRRTGSRSARIRRSQSLRHPEVVFTTLSTLPRSATIVQVGEGCDPPLPDTARTPDWDQVLYPSDLDAYVDPPEIPSPCPQDGPDLGFPMTVDPESEFLQEDLGEYDLAPELLDSPLPMPGQDATGDADEVVPATEIGKPSPAVDAVEIIPAIGGGDMSSSSSDDEMVSLADDIEFDSTESDSG